LLTGATGW